MDTETRTRINENGRLVIPSSFRKALGIEAGDELVLSLGNDELRITTQQLRIRGAKARAKKLLKGRSLAKELLAERREAAKRE